MRHGMGSILGRVVGVIAGLLLVGIVLRLLLAVLQPVLPDIFMRALQGGWDMLLGILGPALSAICAVVILGALVWVVIGKRN